MSTKKSNTPRKGVPNRNQKSRAELRKQLARDLASVFSNPELPVSLHNDIGDALNDLFNDLPQEHIRIDESETYINLLLDAVEAAKGVCAND
jgi:hypothetical protein